MPPQQVKPCLNPPTIIPKPARWAGCAGKRGGEKVMTKKLLLPAKGSMRISKLKAAKAFLSLALQDAAPTVNQDALYLEAVKGDISALAEIANLAWKGKEPFGAGCGCNQVKTRAFPQWWGTRLNWSSAWTKGRYIAFDFGRDPKVVTITWDSGTGKPSRFITETLA